MYASADGGRRVPPIAEPSGLRAVLERYVRAWETADVAGLISMLRDDAIVSMPPAVFLTGRVMIGTFLTESVLARGTRIRMVPISANRMSAFAIYSGGPTDAEVHPYAVVLLDVDGPRIARMSVFADPRLVARFRLPASIAG